MKVSMETLGDISVVRIMGRLDARSTGELSDLLVATVRTGRRKILVELADGAELSRSSVRGLVVAASLARAARSHFRISAGTDLAAFLRRVSFNHLLVIDPDRSTALAHLSGPANRNDTPSAQLETHTSFPPFSLTHHRATGR